MPNATAMAERAYAHTKRLVLSGALPPGQLINESAIATELGISRTPVHEAFLRLETERLLVLYPRRGAAVQPMAPNEARDVVEMRQAIESAAVRRALADAAPPEPVLDGLRRLVAEGDARNAAGDLEGFVECDADLHGALIAASGNATASHLHDLLRDRQSRLRLQLLRLLPQHMAAAAAEHHGLLDAFAARDADRYEELLHRHLEFYRHS
ncbi:GntR family transcriptional regulator [Streptomyces hainanensis]|nr:GntR family transcriptional regulator [Streptomyces hainanensis]